MPPCRRIRSALRGTPQSPKSPILKCRLPSRIRSQIRRSRRPMRCHSIRRRRPTRASRRLPQAQPAGRCSTFSAKPSPAKPPIATRSATSPRTTRRSPRRPNHRRRKTARPTRSPTRRPNSNRSHRPSQAPMAAQGKRNPRSKIPSNRRRRVAARRGRGSPLALDDATFLRRPLHLALETANARQRSRPRSRRNKLPGRAPGRPRSAAGFHDPPGIGRYEGIALSRRQVASASWPWQAVQVCSLERDCCLSDVPDGCDAPRSDDMRRTNTMRLMPWCVLLLSSMCQPVSAEAIAEAADGPDATTALVDQIESDWLLQEVVRPLDASPPGTSGTVVTTAEDAAGACDGVKNGKYGFHTSSEQDPWWQVDLGSVMALDRVVVYNRGDGVSDRAARLCVLLSPDGKTWAKAYEHDGTVFHGFADNRPLSVRVTNAQARFVRIQLPGVQYLHLDEVEVFPVGGTENIALHRPADQSSTSGWSMPHGAEPAAHAVQVPASYPVERVVQQGLRLADSLRRHGTDVREWAATVREVADKWEALPRDAAADQQRALYLEARHAVRDMTLANPLLDFDDLLLVKRVPGTFTHMSDQYYGWFSRPGGGLFVLEAFKTSSPRLRPLTSDLPPGSILRPDISFDGKRVLFAYCRHYPGLQDEPNKLDKGNIPEDAFYHLFEMNLDGTNLRRLTTGKYDDFDARYLPDGRIVFLSTRRGQAVECTSDLDVASEGEAMPDSYVRCGGGPERPVAVYTLHILNADSGHITRISPFEMFEWTPSVDDQGQILYARWD
ncbi:MAG: hypothetical protein FJ276_16170, partial [Planctomycetes bacterium]|nr:hypothetical protein [Planctomycetota bacterium]